MSNDAEPPRMLSAPLRLTAMTLRGLGPYLHGARVEIKPLAILCGENGSGKSTWIEMLSKLKKTAGDGGFPFCELYDPDRAHDTTFTRNMTSVLLQPPGVKRPFLPNIGHSSSENAEAWSYVDSLPRMTAEARRSLMRAEDDAKCGPPCCIGLELEAAADWPPRPINLLHAPESFQGENFSKAGVFCGTASYQKEQR